MFDKKTLVAAAGLCAVLLTAHRPALADAAQIANTVCIACHGYGGVSFDSKYPSLAGQQATYVVKQLNEILEGKRDNPEMLPFLKTVSPAEFAGLGAFFAAQKPRPGVVKDAALAAAGKTLFEQGNTATGVPACVGCHQPGAVGNDKYPRLAGQHAAYLARQINSFKTGLRKNDKAREMRAVAEKLSEAEINAAVAYLSGL